MVHRKLVLEFVHEMTRWGGGTDKMIATLDIHQPNMSKPPPREAHAQLHGALPGASRTRRDVAAGWNPLPPSQGYECASVAM